MTAATWSWLVVQPISSSAGPGSEVRSGSLPPPSALALGETVPRIEVSHASAGMVRATSCSVLLQSKRLAASARIVSLRFWRSVEKPV